MHTYRAAPGAYGVLGWSAAVAGVLWSIAIRCAGAPWSPFLALLVAFAGLALLLTRYRLTLGPEALVLARPLQPEQRVPLREIVAVEAEEATRAARARRTLRIRTSSGEELLVPARIFPPEAAEVLLALQRQRLSVTRLGPRPGARTKPLPRVE